MHDKLFANAKAMSEADVTKYAKEIGLDIKVFTADLKSGKFGGKVKADLDLGKLFGVRGTPSFFMNGAWPVSSSPPQPPRIKRPQNKRLSPHALDTVA